MNLESSTVNLLLGAIITLQVWIVRELFNLKARLNLVLARCPQCKMMFKAEGFLPLIVALALLGGTATASAPPLKEIVLAWDYTSRDVDAFVLRGTPTLTTNLAAWPVLATIPALVSNTIVTNFTLTMEPGQMFFVLTASNFWGESGFSNITNTPNIAPAGSGLNLKRKS